jgi:hypothetical protein
MSCFGHKKALRGANEWYDDHTDDYFATKEAEWEQHLEDLAKSFVNHHGYDEITLNLLRFSWNTLKFEEYDIVSYSEQLLEYSELLNKRWAKIVVEFSEWLEEFEYPDMDTWLGNEYEGFLGDMADACYEDYRDRQMGL